MSAQSRQVGGNHYHKHAIQPWDIVDEYGLDFYEGGALKYLLRDKHNRIEDLEKCAHYVEKKIELLKQEQAPIQQDDAALMNYVDYE